MSAEARGITIEELGANFDDYMTNDERAEDCWACGPDGEDMPEEFKNVMVHEVTAWVVMGDSSEAAALRRWLKRNSK
jgi:hypothetical protein